MVNKSEVLSQLKKLGLEEKEVKVYLSLLEQGVQTPLGLSRNTSINRTTIYRVLEKLKEKGLIEEILDQKSTRYQVSDPQKLNLIISESLERLQEVKKLLPNLIENLNRFKKNQPFPTKIIFFRGRSGIQQLLWNTLRVVKGSEQVGYGYLDWNDTAGEKFAEKLRQKYVEKGIKALEIQNEILEDDKFTTNKVYLDKYYRCRIIPKSEIEFNHDTYIYNDVFAFCHIYKGELFGVEIHNKEIAKTQRQIFYQLWKIGKEVKCTPKR